MSELIQILLLGLALGGVYALMASGLTLVFGVMRIVNLAHPIFIIAGAFISYWAFTFYRIDPLLTIPINMVVMFFAGVVVYKTFLARDADKPGYVTITVLLTFAIALSLDGLLGYFFSNTQRVTSPTYATEAIFVGPFFVPKGQFYAAIVSLVLIGLVWAFLKFTRTGYAIRATTQNRAAAQLLGVNVGQISTFTFGLGIALAGASGALMSYLFSFFPAKHWEWIAILMSLIVLGGMGSLLGAVVGAFLLAVASAYVSSFFGPTWSPITFYLALFLILLIRPEGLFGEKREAL
ncbi:MAG: branched-chain amino acid ABC transporter permease [Anaerolineae bacterium]|nr:branched-chain amino acid ABC transporter permease [Anaerolineae bacterium]